jgi:hypothetical protein
VANNSDADLRIDRFMTSCNCTSISPASLTIPAKASRELRATLNLVPKGRESRSAQSREFSVHIAPVIPGVTETTLRWRLRGLVKRGFEVSSSDFIVTEPYIAAEPFPATWINMRCLWPADDVRVSVHDRTVAKVQVSEFEVSTGRFRVQFQPNSELTTGRYKVTLHVESRMAQKTTATSEMNVSFRVTTDVQLTPDRVLFGRVKVGSMREETVRIANGSGAPLEIASVFVPPDSGVIVEPYKSASTENTWRVRQESLTAANVETRVVFQVHLGNLGEQPRIEHITLPVCYEGYGNDPPALAGVATKREADDE